MMEATTSNTSLSAAVGVVVPKENSRQMPANSPPPAYTPRTQPDLTTLAARVIEARQNNNMSVLFQQGHPYTTLLAGTADESDEDDESIDSSPISLRITTAINVSQNNNLVCITNTPADQANAIAQAVVKAIQENSSGRCGIPMIDEQGCPRAIKIEVDAGIHVEGSGNVVGSRDIVNEVLRQRGQLRRRREEVDGESSEQPAKRRRSSQ